MGMTYTDKTDEVCKFTKKFFLHCVFKRNSVRNYINIKNGFPPDKDIRVQAA
jgi:hypothetical protein